MQCLYAEYAILQGMPQGRTSNNAVHCLYKLKRQVHKISATPGGLDKLMVCIVDVYIRLDATNQGHHCMRGTNLYTANSFAVWAFT